MPTAMLGVRCRATVLAVVWAAVAARALAAGPKRNCMGEGLWHEFQHGDFRVTILSDGDIHMSDPFVKGTFDQAELDKSYADAKMSTGPFQFPQNVALLRRGPHVILVDGGTGKIPEKEPRTGTLLSNLEKYGVKASSVTHILLTHGHFDHVGIYTKDLKPMYPNALVYVSRREHEFWMTEATALIEKKPVRTPRPDSLAPAARVNAESFVNEFLVERYQNMYKVYSKKVVLVHPNSVPLPGITFALTPGHTRDHMSIVVRSRGKTLLIAGDMVIGQASNLHHPEWVMNIERNGTQAVKTRREMLASLAEGGFTAVLYHESFPGVGTVTYDGKSYNWKPSKASATIVERCKGYQLTAKR